MKNKLKKESGITLIALIITVIILLILAGVAIASLGNSGLFSKSKDAVNKYTEAQKNEEAELANYLNELENQTKPPMEVPSGFIPIYTRADLENISSGMQGYIIKGKAYDMNANSNYILMNNIDLAGSEWFTLSAIYGEFNGNNKTIKNMTPSQASMAHAFCEIIGAEGIVKNLVFDNVNINYSTNNKIASLAIKNLGKVTNCKVLNSNIEITSGNADIGGLIYENSGVIEKCEVDNSKFLGSEVGGITYFNFGEVISCKVSVELSGGTYVGGLVGMNEGLVKTSVSNATTKKSIEYFGGLVGFNESTGIVEDCLNNVFVEGTGMVSSILVGSNRGLMKNIVNVGKSDANNNFSLDCFGEVNNVYSPYTMGYIYGNSGTIINRLITLTEAQMKQEASFTGLDFENIWKIDEGNSYPRLRAF